MKTNHVRIAGACLLLGLFCAGCSLAESADSDSGASASNLANFRIETDQAVYQPTSKNFIEIAYTLINNTDQTLYITGPNAHLLSRMSKRVGDEWVLAFQYPILDRLAFPLQLESGESHTQQLRIPLPAGEFNAWEIEDEAIEGIFRIQEQIYSRWDQETVSGDLLPEEQRASNTFEIRR